MWRKVENVIIFILNYEQNALNNILIKISGTEGHLAFENLTC